MNENAGNGQNVQPQSQPPQGTQPSADGQPPSQPSQAPSWREDPEYKKTQAGYTRKINELQQQLGQVQAQTEAAKMEGMSDLQQAQYAAEQWRTQAMEQAQQVQSIQAETAKNNDLMDIQNETGVPANAIAAHLESISSNSAHDAWLFARQQERSGPSNFSQQQGQGAPPQQQPNQGQPQQEGQPQGWFSNQNQNQQPQQPPPVNVGGGTPPTASNQIQQNYDAARTKFDLAGMLGAMQEADAAGVELSEW